MATTSIESSGVPTNSLMGMNCNPWIIPNDNKNPMDEPRKMMKNVSMKNCVRMFERFAPTARLMPISLIRSCTTMYMMLATPTPATPSVKLPINPRKMLSPRKK